MNEQALIRRFFLRPHDDATVRLGIGDDGAVLTPPSQHELVMTTDTMVEGTHFSADTHPYDIGYKLMAVNLSDLAAMGAEPKWATLNITLTEINPTWLQAFADGLLHCARSYRVTLIGGDLSKGAQLNLSVHLTGIVPCGKILTRAGAKVEDKLFVSGVIGAAAQALQQVQSKGISPNELSADLQRALLRPQPRVELGIALRDLASSAIDISDGLLHELELVCAASQVGAEIQLGQLPRAELVDIEMGLSGGEDYELLFTVPNSCVAAVRVLADELDCSVTQIGTIVAGKTIEAWRNGQRVALPKRTGFDHFASCHAN